MPGDYGLLGAGLDFHVQARLDEQRDVFKRDLVEAGPEQRMLWFMEWFNALQIEAGELAQTTGWKPWAVEEVHGTVRMDKFIDESADVMIFLGNIWALAGVTGEDIADAIEAKTAVNRQRQESKSYRGGV